MTADQPTPVPDLSSSPPTEAAPIREPEPRSSWPTVIGVIAVVLAALEIVGGCCGAVFGRFVELVGKFPQPGGPPPFKYPAVPERWTVILFILILPLAVFQIVAAVSLLKRRAISGRLFPPWAVLKIVLTLGSGIVGWIIFQPNAESMQGATAAPFGPPGFEGAFGSMVMCLSMAVGCAFPAFVLIWFSRARIKAEVSGWQ